jgi:hypothetical protein
MFFYSHPGYHLEENRLDQAIIRPILYFLFSQQLFNDSYLPKKVKSISHIPMLSNLSILETEYVYHVNINFIPCRGMIHPFAISMSPGSSGMQHDEVTLCHNVFGSIAEIRYSFKRVGKKFFKASFALRDIRVMLDIIVSHILV